MGRLFVVVAAVLAVSGCAPAPAEPPPPSAVGQVEGGPGWERLPDPPLSGRTGATVATVGERVLVVGGWEFLCPPAADCNFPDTPMLRDGALLDPATGEWQPVADAPYGFNNSRSVTIGDRVYVLTGEGRPALLEYDAAADRWTDLGPVPRGGPRYGLPVAVGDRLLVLADADESGERPDQLFDPATGTWRAVPDDPLPSVYDRFAMADGDRLLLFGSSTDEGVGKLAAAYDLGSGEWTRLPDAPGRGYQVWRSGDRAWLNPHFGSTGGGVLDLTTDTWSAFPDPAPAMPEDELDLAGVLGGGSATFEYAAGWVRDTEADRWLRVPPRPAAGYDEQVAAYGEALVVFGGQRWDGSEGELLAETWLWRAEE